MATDTWGMRISTAEREQIERLARLERTTMKEAVLAAIHRRLSEIDQAGAPPGSVLERLEEAGAVGLFKSPEDLSTNKAYMEGFGGGS